MSALAGLLLGLLLSLFSIYLEMTRITQEPFSIMKELMGPFLYIWVFLFIACFLYGRSFSSSKSERNVVKDPQECRSVISATTFRKIDNQLTPLESRAKHNKKLRIVFGVENAFTTTDPQFSQLFTNLTGGLMLLQPCKWKTLADNIGHNTRRWLDTPIPSSSHRLFVPLTTMVQSLTLRFIFLSLFSTVQHVLEVPDAALVKLADAINCTWGAAKKGCDVPAFKENAYLQEALSAIFEYNLSDERNNPLSVILPGFETLWRVVLRMVLELGFRREAGHEGWTKTLVDFANSPNRYKILSPGLSFLVSAEGLVNETLRLYPPTRRIYRDFQQSKRSETTTTYAADVEACHLSPEIWGPDAAVFNPMRWSSLTKAQEVAFMPFGATPFQCPARPSFGPRAIGLLAGVILRELRNEWTLNKGSDTVKVPELKGRLSNERGAYSDLFLVRDDDLFMLS
ncbi:uncharacterized protein LDX57_001080 [Aspergillus melleus]|uniref:uncharacterized protein n=1 Tax=Aspergillus melleus TaxID=138277 RepID=UPI001E8CB91A|nr:uncharacterized protein LDX57_001080 [Aspergillus melleus]KAH8423322.1 hypothetical protein LDX57_001080 [Aspergillus melleus]